MRLHYCIIQQAELLHCMIFIAYSMKNNIFKQARENAGLSVLKLAAMSKVSRPTIHAIEAGKYTNLASMTKVAKALNKKVSITLID